MEEAEFPPDGKRGRGIFYIGFLRDSYEGIRNYLLSFKGKRSLKKEIKGLERMADEGVPKSSTDDY
ncbi:hypothetical protein CMI45_00525 [Candidatus Pacearchaeota archaeon]|nr:hypothetical protein [Candidatus Pacearchaeota archaeon]|tara:strand:- start:1753 stop:1950 length:198 start_codon:yes stop_codon:yes gene_type:complete